MSEALTAQDLWPLVLKLTHDERVKLAKLALRAATDADEVAAYQKAPPAPDEFSLADEPMTWEAQGWDADDVQSIGGDDSSKR